MTTPSLEGIIAAGVAALREALGTPAQAQAITPAADLGIPGAIAARLELGGETGGAVLVAAQGEALAALGGDEASAALGALLNGAAEAIGRLAGELLEPGEPEAVTDPELGAEAVVAHFEVKTDAATIPMALAVDGPATALVPSGERPQVTEAVLPEIEGSGSVIGAGQDLTVLADVSMTVTVELGRTMLQVRELLSLGEGSVIELDQAAGTPVDVLVNGKRVARGDVVVVDEELGVRITEIIGDGR